MAKKSYPLDNKPELSEEKKNEFKTFRTINELEDEQRQAIINAEAAVLVWQELKLKGNVRAPEKLKLSRSNYERLCEAYNLKPRY